MLTPIINDSLLVHLAGVETITGAKTFSAYTSFTTGFEAYADCVVYANLQVAFSMGCGAATIGGTMYVAYQATFNDTALFHAGLSIDGGVFRMYTGGTYDLKISTAITDRAYVQEYSASNGSLLTLDLANSRLGIGQPNPSYILDTFGDMRFFGRSGWGVAPGTSAVFRIGGELTVGTSQQGFLINPGFASDCTSVGTAFTLLPHTATASYTMNFYVGLDIGGIIIGSGSAVTSQYALNVGDLTTATNNRAINLSVSSGTGKYNIFVGGTADNYFGGNVIIGVTTAASGAVKNLVLSNTATLGIATADKVHMAAIDNGAGNAEFQVQPEAGGILAYGSSNLRMGTAFGGFNQTKLLATELMTIAASAFSDSSVTIPAGSQVVAVAIRVVNSIPTATTFSVGVSGATTRYATGIAVAATTTDKGTIDGVRYYAAAAAIRITPSATPATNVGRVRIEVWGVDITPPTS